MQTYAPHTAATPALRSSANLATAIAVIGIWVAALLVAVWSPDLISGSEQEHIPIAAFTIWFYAAIATAFVLLAVAVHGRSASGAISPSLGAIIAVVWLVVAAASVFTPVMETGADPTQIPVAVLVAPVIGTVVTAFLCIVAAGGAADRTA